ncbi:MAG: CHASE3 domain-containing protein [Gemmatimonadales bacterium]
MAITLRTKVGLTLAGVLLLSAGPIYLAWRSSAAFLANATEVVADQSSVGELREVFSLLQDLESGQRGYTLTGDPAFLSYYAGARAQVLPRLQALRPLVSITVHGPALADSLEGLTRAKLAENDHIIELRRTRDFDAARAAVAEGRGRLLMDHIRTVVALVDAVARRELLLAAEQASEQRRVALFGLLLSGVGSLALAVGAGWLISREITAERQRQEELRHTGERLTTELAGVSATLAAQDAQLRAIVAAVPLALVTIDRESTVTFWSPGAERLFGWTADEVLGKPAPNVAPERLQEHYRFRDSVIGGLAFSNRESVRRRKDGTDIDVAISTAPLRSPSGEITGLVAAYVDVRDQRILQEELRQSQKLEAVGRLAGAVAHDFNNLLTAILGFAERAREGLPAGSEYRADLDQATVAAERAAALTHQLLTFSRPQAVTPRAVDLAAVVEAMEPMLGRLIGEQVDLETRLAPDTRVLADPHHIEQVLLNLCINARDAMPDGGRLLVETRTVEPSNALLAQHPDLAAERYALLAVSDSGTGMDEATRQRIFEPFFTTKGGMGTGLGLATVHGIVRQAGGVITVDSMPGRGTSFRIYLRLTEEAVVEAPAPIAAPTLTPSGLVAAVVDDNVSVRSLTTALLEDEGFTVSSFASAEEALVALSGQSRLDLLITDLILGNMDGSALATRLRERYPSLPVLYMSGYTADTDMVRQLLNEPGVRFLDKPFRSAELLQLVAGLLADPAPRG